MKNLPLPAACVAVLGLVALPIAFAASAGSGPKARIFAEFDANKNGVIDGDEATAVRKAFAADPKGQFATYDKNNKDGKLDAAEIAAIKPPGGGGKGGAMKGDGEKKNADDPVQKKS